MARQLLLPMEAAMKLPCRAQGWRVATQIAPSLIPGAGNGRFVSEDVTAGSVVAVKPIRPIGRIETLHDLSADTAVSFSSTADLEKYIALGEADGGFSLQASRGTLEHFLWSLDGQRGILNWSTWSVNHGSGSEMNLDVFLDNVAGEEVVVSEATRDIPAGTELTQDYADFIMPAFYLEYCKQHSFDDVRTAVMNVINE